MSEQIAAPIEDDVICSLTAYVHEMTGIQRAPIITPLAEGCHSRIYRCDTVPDGISSWPSTCVIRYPKGAMGIAQLDGCEARAATLADTAAPQILRLGRLSCGTPIVFEQYIAGESRVFATLVPHDIAQLAQMIRGIHAQTGDRYSSVAGGPPTTEGTYADYIRMSVQESVIDRMRLLPMDRYPEARLLLSRGLRRFTTELAARSDAFSGSTFCRLHHDLNQENVLWQNNQPIPIDPNITYGDPADDLDYVCTDNQVLPSFRASLLDAYGEQPWAGDIAARIPLYTLKNKLDDMTWAISMREADPVRHEVTYQQRYANLDDFLASSHTFSEKLIQWGE